MRSIQIAAMTADAKLRSNNVWVHKSNIAVVKKWNSVYSNFYIWDWSVAINDHCSRCIAA